MSLFSYNGKHAEGTAKVRLMEQLRRAGEALSVGFADRSPSGGAYPIRLAKRGKELIAFGGMLVYGFGLFAWMLGAAGDTPTVAEVDSSLYTGEPQSVVVTVQPMATADTLVHIGEPVIDESEVLSLAIGIDAVISSVPGGELASDVTMVMVASTIMNRVEDPRYPDTVEEVLCQPYQFSCFSETGLKWVGVAADNDSFRDRCMTAAERVLTGERMLSAHVVYVSSARQGTVEAQLDGLYFCR